MLKDTLQLAATSSYQFGLGYAELGLLRGLFSGTMASFQIPAGLIVDLVDEDAPVVVTRQLPVMRFCPNDPRCTSSCPLPAPPRLPAAYAFNHEVIHLVKLLIRVPGPEVVAPAAQHGGE